MALDATVHQIVTGSRKVIRRLGAAASGSLVILLTLAAPVQATPRPVDPSTLNPAPPASFNATCFRTGSHISCDLAFSDPDVIAEPSGIICDGTELLVTQHRSVVGKRLYDANGNLLQRHFREYLDGTYTNPDTGLVALWTQHNSVVHDLAVPGDVGSGIEQITGGIRIWIAGGGTILTDAGTVRIDIATDEGIRSSRHHPFDEYFGHGDASALAPLCSALD